MHWPRIRGLEASAGVWLMAKEKDISAVLEAQKGLYFANCIVGR